MSRRLLLGLVLLPFLGTGAGGSAPAQSQGISDTRPTGDKPADNARPSPSKLALVEPVSYRVYQRDRNNRAEIPIVFDAEATIIYAAYSGTGSPAGMSLPGEVKSLSVPTGGPYTISITAQAKDSTPGGTIAPTTFQIGPVYVGDLWVLAGQSNMEGVGNLEDVTPPSEKVSLLGMDGHWRRAEEPLHWLVDSPDPVHSGDPATRAERSGALHKNRVKGAGLGLPFGVVLSAATGIPIGLIATAHGGTSMKGWDPARKDEGGRSLYGSMLGQIRTAGGKVRGMLWYQGESDANPEAAKVYPKVFAGFINSVRSDLGAPDLPFYLVQIGRVIRAGDPTAWNAVQDAERQIPDRLPGTAVVASIDLELDDLIHVGTQGLRRLGTRLARTAEREVYGLAGATTPSFERVMRRGDRTLIVKFGGVNRVPVTASTPTQPRPQSGPGPQLSGPSLAVSPGQSLTGLQPARHIAGFSIRKEDGTETPLIHDAAVGPSQDTVILKLTGAIPKGSYLWYGYGFDPYCTLIDALDMAVPVFGPIPLDDVE
jgi:sialate O-acetylesterase